MRKRFAIMIVAGSLLSMVAPSAADAAQSDCPASHVCVWQDSDFAGAMSDVGWYSEPMWAGFGVSKFSALAADDQASSVYNGTSQNFCLAELEDRGGRVVTIPPMTGLPNLNEQGFDNVASSLYWC